MGNDTSALYYTCHSCKQTMRYARDRVDVRHGFDWVVICNPECYQTWKKNHDHKGYCCSKNPEDQQRRPLLIK